jgi:VCBS repeat-containing protein
VPNAGVSETINYTIEDADGDPSSTTLVIAVSNTNQMPVAVADTDAASEGGVAISGNVITGEGTDGNPAGADTLGDTPTTVTFANQNGNAITVNAVGVANPVSFTTAAGGSLTLYANGSYTYTPPAAGTVPNAGVSETINYTIEDADGDPSSTTLVIAVSNTNQMPVAVADTDAASEGGVAISGNVITGEGTDGNPAGADTLGDTPTTVTFANQNGNAITVNAVGVANPVSFTTAAGGSLTLYANGSYTYTPPAAGTVPNAGVSETINYTIEDADGDPSSTTLVIAVSNTNQMPVAVADTDAASEGGVAISGNVITGEGTDGNPAGADTLGDTPTTVTFANQNGNAITVNAVGVANPVSFTTAAGGSLTLYANGSYTVHAACGGDGAERGCERDDQLHH